VHSCELCRELTGCNKLDSSIDLLKQNKIKEVEEFAKYKAVFPHGRHSSTDGVVNIPSFIFKM
jgi:hypothetical protein